VFDPPAALLSAIACRRVLGPWFARDVTVKPAALKQEQQPKIDMTTYRRRIPFFIIKNFFNFKENQI
jgi:hypothetical protein